MYDCDGTTEEEDKEKVVQVLVENVVNDAIYLILPSLTTVNFISSVYLPSFWIMRIFHPCCRLKHRVRRFFCQTHAQFELQPTQINK